MNLKVKIKAPIIIVPIDSQTLKALCLDLGLIKVSNHFTDHFLEDRNAVIDDMKLELTDFKLFHADVVPQAGDDGESIYAHHLKGYQLEAPDCRATGLETRRRLYLEDYPP